MKENPLIYTSMLLLIPYSVSLKENIEEKYYRNALIALMITSYLHHKNFEIGDLYHKIDLVCVYYVIMISFIKVTFIDNVINGRIYYICLMIVGFLQFKYVKKIDKKCKREEWCTIKVLKPHMMMHIIASLGLTMAIKRHI